MDHDNPPRIDRRTFLARSGLTASAFALFNSTARAQDVPAAAQERLPVPESGTILVAFAISQGANVIDTAGPWEVFQDVSYEENGRRKRPFRLVTVAPAAGPVHMTGGLTVLAGHSYADAPQPNVIVVPAQSGSAELHEWLRKSTERVDVTMSVCTGAIQLAAAGLLNGIAATTHHEFYDQFAKRYPEVQLIRGRRFVDNGKIATAGGLTSGFDMALHVVARYFGPDIAKQTAEYMEYDHYTGSPVRAAT
jgi:transcriptional regulator GlxA family with amidase domain